MNLIDYLRSRHPTVNALTRAEAEIIGLDYPLVKGWVDKYENLYVPEDMFLDLVRAKNKRYKKVASINKKTMRKIEKVAAKGCSDINRLSNNLMKPSKRA